MKKIFFAIMLLAFTYVSAYAQKDSFSKIYEEYEDIKGVESVSISPKAFTFFMDDEEEAEMFKKMNALKLLTAEGEVGKKLQKDVISFVKKGGYEEIMKVKEGDTNAETVYMYSKPTELIFVALSGEECAIIYISGTIDKEIIKAVSDGKLKVN